MARLPRLYAPGCARHIIQRGNTVPLNLRDGVVTEKPEKGIKDTDPLIL